MTSEQARQELACYGRLLSERHLVVGAGGNTSVRAGRRLYIKPSGFGFDELEPQDYVGADLETGELVDGDRRPSCEIAVHVACYRQRPDVGAVVHSHPPMAIGLVNAGRELRPITPDFVAYVGRSVAHLPFIVPAGPELGEAVGQVIGGVNAVMMLNHGLVTVGRTLKEAFLRTLILEDAATCLVASYSIGEPRFLTEAEIEAVAGLSAESYRQALLAPAQ